MFYLPTLSFYSVPLTGDQKVYINVALEMWERSSILKPYLFEVTNYLKPPLQYWSTLLGWEIFGFHLFGAVIGSVFAVFLTSLLLGEIARSLGWPRQSRLAGLFYATTVGTLTFGTTVQMEIWVALFFVASWWAAIRFLKSEEQPGFLYLAFVLAGAAAWVKSPIYSVLWVLSFWGFLVSTGRGKRLLEKHFIMALLVGMGVGLSWYLYILAVDGERFWQQFVMQENFGKRGGNQSAPWQIWFALFYYSFPLSFVLIPAFAALFKEKSDFKVLVISSVLICGVFFTAFPYRVNTYLFILMPLLALVAEWAVTQKKRWIPLASRLTAPVLFLVPTVVGFVLYRAEMAPMIWFLTFSFLGLAGAIFLWRARWLPAAVVGLALMGCFRWGAVIVGERDLEPLRHLVSKDFSAPWAFVNESKNIWHPVGLFSTAIGKPMDRLYGGTDQWFHKMTEGTRIVFSDSQTRKWKEDIERRAREYGLKIDWIPWRRWARRLKFPFKELVLYGRAGIEDAETRFYRTYWVAIPRSIK